MAQGFWVDVMLWFASRRRAASGGQLLGTRVGCTELENEDEVQCVREAHISNAHDTTASFRCSAGKTLGTRAGATAAGNAWLLLGGEEARQEEGNGSPRHALVAGCCPATAAAEQQADACQARMRIPAAPAQ
jgi:hypothetical protein